MTFVRDVRDIKAGTRYYSAFIAHKTKLTMCNFTWNIVKEIDLGTIKEDD